MSDQMNINGRPIVDVCQVGRSYGSLAIFQEAHFSILAGQRLALVGPSGTGKSTLLNILGLLDTPSQGEVLYHHRGQTFSSNNLCDRRATELRRSMLGFIFQSHHLLPEFTALENVLLPAQFAGQKGALKRGKELLDRVGLKDRMSHRPCELSGGQQQRVAIARALINNPELILADEPTGNLDETTGREVFQLLTDMNTEEGASLFVVTHNQSLLPCFHKIFFLEDGRLIES